MYGAKLADQWAGCDLDQVKAAWDEGLAGLEIDEVRAGIAAAVRSGKPFPPTLPEFYVMCRPKIDVPPVNDHAGLDRLARLLGVSANCHSYFELRQRLLDAAAERSTVPRLH